MWILYFKITCILRSPVDKYTGPGFEKTEHVQDSSLFLIYYFWCLTTIHRTHLLLVLLLCIFMMLYMTSSTPECFRHLGLGVWQTCSINVNHMLPMNRHTFRYNMLMWARACSQHVSFIMFEVTWYSQQIQRNSG